MTEQQQAQKAKSPSKAPLPRLWTFQEAMQLTDLFPGPINTAIHYAMVTPLKKDGSIASSETRNLYFEWRDLVLFRILAKCGFSRIFNSKQKQVKGFFPQIMAYPSEYDQSKDIAYLVFDDRVMQWDDPKIFQLYLFKVLSGNPRDVPVAFSFNSIEEELIAIGSEKGIRNFESRCPCSKVGTE